MPPHTSCFCDVIFSFFTDFPCYKIHWYQLKSLTKAFYKCYVTQNSRSYIKLHGSTYGNRIRRRMHCVFTANIFTAYVAYYNNDNKSEQSLPLKSFTFNCTTEKLNTWINNHLFYRICLTIYSHAWWKLRVIHNQFQI